MKKFSKSLLRAFFVAFFVLAIDLWRGKTLEESSDFSLGMFIGTLLFDFIKFSIYRSFEKRYDLKPKN
jgi:hypothetical protein